MGGYYEITDTYNIRENEHLNQQNDYHTYERLSS